MIITLEQLKSKDACDEALKAFKAAVGAETADIEWNEAAQGWILADPLWRVWLGWGWYNKIIPMWSMRGATLSGATLSWADLTGANLTGANSNKYTTWPKGYNDEN